MDVKRWSWAIIGGALVMAALVVLFIAAMLRDEALPHADFSGEAVLIDESVPHVVTNDSLEPMDSDRYRELVARMTNSSGRPGSFAFFPAGTLWYQFTVPSLQTSEWQWTIRLRDPRAISARLFVVHDEGASFDERAWRYDSPLQLAGLGGRSPSFQFDRAEIEGKTVLVGLTSRGRLVPAAAVETDRVTHATEMRNAQLTSLLIGGLWAVSILLVVIGVRMQSFTLLAASVLILWFGILGYGADGYLRTLLAPWPSAADVLLYGGQPWSMSAFLLLVIAYLGLISATPRLATVFLIAVIVFPMQGIALLLFNRDGGLPFLGELVVPLVIGIILGNGTILWFALVRRDRRAWFMFACLVPVVASGTLRALAYVFPTDEDAINQAATYGDMLVTPILLTLLAVLEFHRRQEALRNTAETNERRFRSFAEIATDSFFETDSLGVVVNAAGPLVREFGVQEGTDLPQLLQGVALPDQRPVVQQLARALARQTPLRDIEIAVERPQDRRAWISINVTPWQPLPQQSAGMRGTIRDVTKRVERREQEARQAALLSLGQLASGVAHEVNNLLHPMINLSRRVRDHGGQDEESKRLLDVVVTSGQHAGEIVAGVLSAFNPTKTPGVPCAIDEALATALEAVRTTLPGTIELVESIETGSGVTVVPGEMLQVISNLMSNAIHALDGHGRIAVSLHRDATGVTILMVEDNGPGMPGDIAKRATEPFVSGGATGTGLGLYIVKTIVNSWGGTLAIASEPGSGTKISIIFPA